MRGFHSDYILGNAVNLPIKRKSFDTVLCSEVLEHLEKKKGWEMIKAVEEIACKQVIISMPSKWPLIEKYDTVDDAIYGHKSSWSPHELRESGYRVRGFGLRHIRVGGIRSEGGLMWAQVVSYSRKSAYRIFRLKSSKEVIKTHLSPA